VASPAELYDEPATPFVAEFVGTMNRLPGKLLGGSRVAVLGREVPARGPFAKGGAGQEVDVLVRPEALALAPVHGANGIVSALTFRGAQSRVDVLLWADMSVKVDVPSPQAGALAIGASVEVSLVSDNVLVDSKVGGPTVTTEEG
jgi:putative spermidine/putrescine transport system ATP-binding protein